MSLAGTAADPGAPPMASRDPDATRRKLLDAAREEFSDKGIDGARVDAIAARAGVNKQLVYYYFESKDGLFRALLRDRLAAPKGVPADDCSSTGERMAAAARLHFEDPDHVRLLMWEALEAGPHGTVAEEEARTARYQELVDRVRAAQEAGEISPDLDPAQVLLSRVAQAMFPVAFPQITRIITGRTTDDAELVAEREAFLRQAYR